MRSVHSKKGRKGAAAIMTPRIARPSKTRAAGLYKTELTPYVAQPSRAVRVALENIVPVLQKYGDMTPEELVKKLGEGNRVGERELREAIWRLMSSGDIRVTDNWKLGPTPLVAQR